MSADSNRRDVLFVKRRRSRILWSVLAIPIVIVIYLLVLAYPEPLFAHSLSANNFTFYSNSQIDPGILQLTDEVNANLKRSEIFDQSVHFRVFIVGDKHLYTFFNGPYRGAIARNYEIGNAIFIPTLDVEHRRIVHFDGSNAGPANILAHEAVHTLMARRLGLYRSLKLPWWKREGYAEFIARDLGRSSRAPKQYQDAMKKVICLMETRRLGFDEMIKQESAQVICP